MYEYNAEVLRVVDGDTYEILVNVGFDIFHKIHLRLQGVNAAEIDGPTKTEGYIAKDYVTDLFSEYNNQIVIRTKYKRSFTRWVGDVFINGFNLAEHLLVEGYAVVDKRG